MAKQIIKSDKVPEPMGPYSQCVLAKGRRFIFLSGQVPEDAHGNLVGKSDIEIQARQVFTNLKTLVEEAGGTVADIVKITIYMVAITPFTYEVIGKIRREFFGSDYPASTMVEVKRLVSPNWLIEVEGWAVLE